MREDGTEINTIRQSTTSTTLENIIPLIPQALKDDCSVQGEKKGCGAVEPCALEVHKRMGSNPGHGSREDWASTRGNDSKMCGVFR